MSFTARVTKTVTEGSMSITNSNSYVVESSFRLQEAVLDATTNKQFLFAIDVSELKAFSMQSTVNMTVYTNDAGTGTPQETFTLLANNPVIFEVSIDSAIFAGDVTSFYVTNTSGSDGQLNIIAAVNTA
jgi:hypothetical protein